MRFSVPAVFPWWPVLPERSALHTPVSRRVLWSAPVCSGEAEAVCCALLGVPCWDAAGAGDALVQPVKECAKKQGRDGVLEQDVASRQRQVVS